jgi:hypothetical protein
MLTFLAILGRSLRIAAALLAVDSILAYVLTLLTYSFVETMGDLMLFEVAILFILAGLLDFSSSIGAAQFRKTILHSKLEYSSVTHKEVERKAAVFFLGGLIIFLVLVLFAIFLRT